MKRLMCVAVLLLLGGCVEYTEELWFNKDMTGRIRVDVSIEEKYVKVAEKAGGDFFSEEGLRGLFEGLDGIRVIEATASTSGQRRYLSLTMQFSSPDALRKAVAVRKETEFLGSIYLIENQDKTFSYERMLALTPDARRMADNERVEGIPWKFTVHIPGKILDANTPPDEGAKKNSRSWVYPTNELSSGPHTMKILYAEISAFDYIAFLVAGAVFLAIFIVLYRALTKKEREAESA